MLNACDKVQTLIFSFQSVFQRLGTCCSHRCSYVYYCLVLCRWLKRLLLPAIQSKKLRRRAFRERGVNASSSAFSSAIWGTAVCATHTNTYTQRCPAHKVAIEIILNIVILRYLIFNSASYDYFYGNINESACLSDVNAGKCSYAVPGRWCIFSGDFPLWATPSCRPLGGLHLTSGFLWNYGPHTQPETM